MEPNNLLISLFISLFAIGSAQFALDTEKLLTPAENTEKYALPVHYKIAKEILQRYNKGYIPKRIGDGPIKVNFSMELYQIIQINEPQQYMLINAWIVERWVDNLLGWDPDDFANVTELMVPYENIWIPDTTLYNSLVMDDTHTRRLLNAKLSTRGKGKGALVELLYPTIYKQSCMLDLRFFPFDLQSCKMTFGSWTYDNTLIDYFPHNKSHAVGTANCIENEGWKVLSTEVERHENKYDCCPNNYTLLEFRLNVQRKPLYYVINLIAPTSIITFISIVGFFSSPSINDLRQEKITLGITTLLSMSILVFMVSDKMPSTSSFIPLIGWFYTSMILLISLGTVAASLVIYVQKQGIIGKPPPKKLMAYAMIIARLIRLEKPLLMKQAYAQKAREEKLRRQQLQQQGQRRRSLWHKVVDAARESKQNGTTPRADHVISPGPQKLLQIPSPNVFLAKKRSASLRTEDSIHSENGDMTGLVNFAASDADDDSGSFTDFPLIAKKSDALASLEPSLASPSPTQIRDLAQIEFDWLAAVFERVFLIVFIIIFLFTSVGINLLGFYKWCAAQN